MCFGTFAISSGVRSLQIRTFSPTILPMIRITASAGGAPMGMCPIAATSASMPAASPHCSNPRRMRSSTLGLHRFANLLQINVVLGHHPCGGGLDLRLKLLHVRQRFHDFRAGKRADAHPVPVHAIPQFRFPVVVDALVDPVWPEAERAIAPWAGKDIDAPDAFAQH